MLIDWFTVVAQIGNFLVLVWLLGRFLYKPVLHAIDQRDAHVAAERTDADTKKAEAQAEHEEFRKKNETFDRERADRVTRMTSEVDAERARLVEAAHKDADTRRMAEEHAWQTDRASLADAMTRSVEREVFEIARKVLADLATESLEGRIVDTFCRRVVALDSAAKATLQIALSEPATAAVVRTRFELSPEQRAAIQLALDPSAQAHAQLRFEATTDGVCGIELLAGGQRVAWSVGEYLGSLAKAVDALVDTRPEPNPHPVPVALAAPTPAPLPSVTTKAA